MSLERPVALSLYPELVPDRPVGPILASVQTGTNADLIAAVAPFYLAGSVLDVTYGEGKWWTRFTPEPFTKHDLYKVDGVDFRALPEPDASIDTVCYDPPYVPEGGQGTTTAPDYRDRFGLATYRSQAALDALIAEGLAECARVARTWLLVKCTDYVNARVFTLGHRKVLDMADALGLSCHDLIVHHTGSGPGGHNVFTPIRARRHHSYLLVFTKKRAR